MQFVLDRIEDSMHFNIEEYDLGHIIISQKPELEENPSTIHVVLHNNQTKMKKTEFLDLLTQNSAQGIFTSNVFYKDGEKYMVRLGSLAQKKSCASLKRYSKKVRDSIIRLRDIEKIILAHQYDDKMLIYYQPESPRLDESLNFYIIRTPLLDYQHMTPEHPAYNHVRDLEEARAYKIPIKEFIVYEGGVDFEQPTKKNKEEKIFVMKPLDKEQAKENAEDEKGKSEYELEGDMIVKQINNLMQTPRQVRRNINEIEYLLENNLKQNILTHLSENNYLHKIYKSLVSQKNKMRKLL